MRLVGVLFIFCQIRNRKISQTRKTMTFFAVLTAVLVLLTASVPSQAANAIHSAPRKITALRINSEPPRMDGRLDDAVWRDVPSSGDFLQLDPVEGERASEATTIKIAYDEEAVYFGIRCYDSHPAGIVSRLTRRDGETEADWVSISIDPHLDRQTGRFFTVYASGSVIDGTYANDRSRDDTWNGVWAVETVVDAEGWSAEFRIPYYVLRFSPQVEYVWGFNVERHVSRKQERSHWNLMRKRQPGLVSQFGYLEGIHDIEPPLGLEYMPYAMGRTILDGGTDYFGNAGLDVRYGVTSSLSLNATVNPDFGQVEADPAQLNLTAFEDFFQEQRPFFVEGASIFRTNDYELFYSRRIGRQPGYFSLPEDAVELDRPEATTILGAFKLTGKTQGKTAFGLLHAVTASERADIEKLAGAGSSAKDAFLVEPLTNYLVGRVRQDVLNGTSGVGLFASSVHRRNGPSAYVGAADWDLKFRDNTYNVTGALVGSRAGAVSERRSGYIAHLEFDKRGGWLEAETGFAALSPDLEINDLGFLRRGNLIRNWGQAQAFRYTPVGPFREFDVRIQGEAEWNYDRMRLDNSANLSYWGDLHNYWRVHLH
jgi:energy-converting hydrogenase Eha subunit F